jgi:hypothetical protein
MPLADAETAVDSNCHPSSQAEIAHATLLKNKTIRSSTH